MSGYILLYIEEKSSHLTSGHLERLQEEQQSSDCIISGYILLYIEEKSSHLTSGCRFSQSSSSTPTHRATVALPMGSSGEKLMPLIRANMRVFLFLGAALFFPLLFAADDYNTHGKMAELHSEDHGVIPILDYIYSKIKTLFDNIRIEEGDFQINEKTSVKVPFMKMRGMCKVAFTDEATVVSKPYKADAEAFFILPAEGKLSEIEENLNEETIQKWKKLMKKRYVDLSLPKINVSRSINLQELLTNMPLVEVFSDLSGITGETKAVREAMPSLDEKVTDSIGTIPHEIIVDPPPVIVVLPISYLTVLFLP
ncbi:alpha-1-antitrypsin-like isoform X2 [Phyllobates terribilis]|uniref:alpha-1-antitrypsin-like isoform X2 n=1 Tax=Phyllobates terribilis TaxID=111132 RepID=UPI003CCA8701